MMKRSNLIKGIISGLMLTTVLGSAVLANTDRIELYIGNGNYTETTTSYAGTYIAYAGDESFTLTSMSTSDTSRKFNVEAIYRNWYDDKMLYRDYETAILTNEKSIYASIGRDRTDVFRECYGRAVTFNSTQEYLGICDDYSFIFNQRSN